MSLKRHLGPLGRGARSAGARLRAGAVAAARWAGRSLRRGALALFAPGAVVLIMLAAGAACTVAGVWMLAGTPWALLAAAAVLFTLAGLALRGMLNG